MFHNASSHYESNKIIWKKKKKRKNNKKETIYKINKNHYFLEKYYKFFFDRSIELLPSTRSTIFSSIYLFIYLFLLPTLPFEKKPRLFFSRSDPRDHP